MLNLFASIEEAKDERQAIQMADGITTTADELHRCEVLCIVNRYFPDGDPKPYFAEVEKKRVAAYIAPVFARFSFVDDIGAAITDPELLFCCDDEAMCVAYYAACDVAHRERGFTGEAGRCPALITAHETLKAEWAVLASMEQFVGLDDGALSRTMEIRAEALKLAAGVALAGR